jgi:hypothetical protein
MSSGRPQSPSWTRRWRLNQPTPAQPSRGRLPGGICGTTSSQPESSRAGSAQCRSSPGWKRQGRSNEIPKGADATPPTVISAAPGTWPAATVTRPTSSKTKAATRSANRPRMARMVPRP